MEQQDASTLYHNINFWGRKNIPADRAAFKVLEELVLHSFGARIVGLLYTRLEQRGVDTSPSIMSRRSSLARHAGIYDKFRS
jgi:hypothetical protein